jgi:hypothetical protein
MLPDKKSQLQSAEGYQALDRPWSGKAQSTPAVDARYEDNRKDSVDGYLARTAEQNPLQTQGLTPMQRWAQETVQEQPWNDIAAFAMDDNSERKA